MISFHNIKIYIYLCILLYIIQLFFSWKSCYIRIKVFYLKFNRITIIFYSTERLKTKSKAKSVDLKEIQITEKKKGIVFVMLLLVMLSRIKPKNNSQIMFIII